MTDVVGYLIQLGPIIFGFLIGIIPGWVILKGKIHQLTEFFIAVDEAIYDDAVSEAEFRKIFEKGRALFEGAFAFKKK
jgi:hypothetical protein